MVNVAGTDLASVERYDAVPLDILFEYGQRGSIYTVIWVVVQ